MDQKNDDQDLDLKVDDKESEDQEEQDDKGDDSWKDKQKVPYRRLEAQSRKVQKLEEELKELKSKFSPTEKDKTPKGVWDNRIKNAQSWDEVFNELPGYFAKVLVDNPEMKSQLTQAIKSELKNEDKSVEEKVNREIDDLWDKDIITTKEQENRVIKYAVKEAEETGEYIPLAVAVRMMKKEGVWDKKIEDRKDANNKIRPGDSKGSNENKEKSNYNAWRHESIDSVVEKAASKFKA